MDTQRVAISGIDGAGKTTVIRKIKECYAQSPHLIYAIRAPQFHEDRMLPFGRLSQIIDKMNDFADQNHNPWMKASALFLSMTCYGDIENHIQSTYRPRLIFTERQCLVDTLAYSHFYLPLLIKEVREKEVKKSKGGQSVFQLSTEDCEIFKSWLSTVKDRDSMAEFDLSSFSFDPLKLFSGSTLQILDRLKRVFHARLPDELILLTISEKTLVERLQTKRNNSVGIELHEKVDVLNRLQSSLREVAQQLKMIQPELTVREIATDCLSVEETVAQILKARGKLDDSCGLCLAI